MTMAAHAAPRTIRNPLPAMLARARTAAAKAKAKAVTLRSASLQISGLALLSVSAGLLSIPAGIAAAGVSCFVLEFLTSTPPGSRR
jgi:hypothetical protein